MRVIFYSQIFILSYGFIVSYSLNGADGFYSNPRPVLALIREGMPRTLKLKKKREQEEREAEKERRQVQDERRQIQEDRKRKGEERRQLQEKLAANRKNFERSDRKGDLRRKSALRLTVGAQQQKNAAQEAQECSLLINPWSAMRDLVIEDQESDSGSDE